MGIIDTLDDIETLMKFMAAHDVAEVQVEGIVIKSRPRPINIEPQKRVTDEELLMNPYAGLNI